LHPECHPENFLALSTVYINGREDSLVESVDIALIWAKDEVAFMSALQINQIFNVFFYWLS
jgi:hypothetical protein